MVFKRVEINWIFEGIHIVLREVNCLEGTDKNTRILILHYQLLTGKKIRKQTFCLEHRITERSFDRDIEDVRLFLSDELPYCELSYDWIDKTYFLTHIIGGCLSGEEALLMINVLLSQKYLRDDELQCMLSSILAVTDSSRRKILYNFLGNNQLDRKNEGKNAILKMQWDLSQAIHNCMQITLEYEIESGKYVQRKVNPVELYFEGGYVYLIAFNVEKAYKHPAFYRSDRIHSFKVIGKKYSEKVQVEYQEQHIHSNRYGMLAGEEVYVTIQVENSMERVVNDLFPESKMINSDSKGYVFEINTYNQGFINWLLGQGRKVVIIKPEEIKQEVVLRMKEVLEIYKEEDVK